MADRSLDTFFLPGHAAIVRPVPPGQTPRQTAQPAVELPDALCELTAKLSLKARMQLEVWVRTEHLPLVADRVVDFLRTLNVAALSSLTLKERQTLYQKIKGLQ